MANEFAEKHPLINMFLFGILSMSISLWLLIIPIIGIPMMIVSFLITLLSILLGIINLADKLVKKFSKKQG